MEFPLALFAPYAARQAVVALLSSMLVLSISFMLSAAASAQQPERQWRVHMGLVSGQNTYCHQVSGPWIREGGGMFRLYEPRNRQQAWAAPMAADGSVDKAEVRDDHARRPIRVTVPAGTEPRGFDVVDLSQGCRYRFEPL